MTRIEYLQQEIRTLRENGADPEDISVLAQELNMELVKQMQTTGNVVKGGGKRGKKNG